MVIYKFESIFSHTSTLHLTRYILFIQTATSSLKIELYLLSTCELNLRLAWLISLVIYIYRDILYLDYFYKFVHYEAVFFLI
jgi:hypothetical protein